MDPIYVTGHRNPDTDSIVAAMAYAALRNACGDREYEAACLGNVSDETQIVLDRFGFQPPRRIHDLYTQIRSASASSLHGVSMICTPRSGTWILIRPRCWARLSPSAVPGMKCATTAP